MRFREIVAGVEEPVEEQASGTVKPTKPLSPEQAMARQKRKNAAQANLRDTRAISAIKVRRAQRKVDDT